MGAFVGLGLSFLLNLFGLGIGLAAFSTSDAGVTSFFAGAVASCFGGYYGVCCKKCCPHKKEEVTTTTIHK